jgi:hypothetical protein
MICGITPFICMRNPARILAAWPGQGRFLLELTWNAEVRLETAAYGVSRRF